MDPNTPNNPMPVPEPPKPPQASAAPVPPAPPVPPTGSGITEPAGKKTGLIVGIVVMLIALLAAAALSWVFIFSPAAQAKKASTTFMKAVTTKDTDKLFELTGTTEESMKKFLTSAAESSEGSFTLKQSTMQDGKGYFLYDLSNEKGKEARTIVQKEEGKWIVDSYVFGSDNLALVPGEKQNQAEASPESTPDPTLANQCLVQSDFDAWYKEEYGQTATELGFTPHKPENAFNTNVHFPPDSLEYKNFDNVGAVEKVTRLAKDSNVANKQFTIRLYGSVATSQADADFANKRAERIKADLVANGIPASKIAIDPPQSATDYEENPNEVSQRVSRVVVIKFDPTCSGSSSDTGR